jgi:hypothetical protein
MNLAKYLASSAAIAILTCSAPALVQAQSASPSAAPSASTAPPAGAPSQKQLDIAAARAERKAVVGENMSLTDPENKAFWPLYDEYEGKMDKIEDRHVREIKEFASHFQNLTNADARKKLN